MARRIALGELAELPIDFPVDLDSAGASLGLDVQIASLGADVVPFQIARLQVLREFEQKYVAHVLTLHNGNVTAAAAASGLARRYFQILRSGKRR